MGWLERRSRLVERHRDHLVAAQIADIAELDGQVVARLPLNIQRVVDGVRQLVGAVVNAQRDRLPPLSMLARLGR